MAMRLAANLIMNRAPGKRAGGQDAVPSMDPFTFAGFVGAALVVAAYFANQMERLPSTDWRFPFANLVGAALIMASFAVAWNLPAFIIELFWCAISLLGFLRQILRRQAGRAGHN